MQPCKARYLLSLQMTIGVFYLPLKNTKSEWMNVILTENGKSSSYIMLRKGYFLMRQRYLLCTHPTKHAELDFYCAITQDDMSLHSKHIFLTASQPLFALYSFS